MKKIFKSKIFLLVVISLISISAVFAYSYIAGDVGYTPTDTEWNVDNTKDALDDLYDVTRQCVFGCPYRPGDVVYERNETISDKFTSKCDGFYQIEVWGAQGGSTYGATGGYGAYAVGVVNLKEDDTLFVNVGGQPMYINDSSLNTYYGGGYNGGGKGCGYGDKANTSYPGYGAAGGGATSVAFVYGELSTLQSYKGTLATDYYVSDEILIVAAGGGGSGYWDAGYDGGDGGGISGQKGEDRNSGSPKATGGGGGTQTSGGTALESGTKGGFPGTFGKGGDSGNDASDAWAGGGGGGGFYGGGSGNDYGSGGGGGSSYIASSKLISDYGVTKSVYCYMCASSSAIQTKTISVYTTPEEGNPSNCPNGHSSSAVSKCPKEGDGSIKITFLGV